MRGTKRLVTYTALAGVVAWLAAGCGTGSTSTGVVGNDTIKICTEFPVSGADASGGKPPENGVTLAVKEANDKHTLGAYKLKVVHYDDVGPSGTHDGPTGANNIRQAIGDALVAGCVGPLNSSVAVAEMPLANFAPMAMISPANTADRLTKPAAGQLGTLRPTNKVTYFRISTVDSKQGPANADYLFKTLHLTNVYIIDDTETFGKGVADSFQGEWTSLGGKLAGRIGLDKSTTDYVPALTAAAAKSPDVIFCGCNDSTGGIKVRLQIGSVPGLEKVVYAGPDGMQTDDYVKATGTAGLGTITTVASVNPDTLPTGKAFKDAFTKVFPNAADYGAYSASGYDAANIMIQAIKKAIADGAHNPKGSSDASGAKLFRQAVIDQIAKTSYDGVTGHTTFDINGDNNNRWISIYKDGPNGWDFVTQLTV